MTDNNDISEWRDLPVTKAFAKDISFVLNKLRASVGDIFKIRDLENAKKEFYIAQGRIMAYSNILRDLTREENND